MFRNFIIRKKYNLHTFNLMEFGIDYWNFSNLLRHLLEFYEYKRSVVKIQVFEV